MQGSQPTALRMQMATYVMQGYKVDQEDLATLRDSFQDLPEGWKYSVVTPDEDILSST